jgi:hypothetical protein
MTVDDGFNLLPKLALLIVADGGRLHFSLYSLMLNRD